MKHKTSLIAAIVLVIAGCVLRFAMPGHDFLGYTLWGIAVLVFLFPRLHRVGRIVLGVLVCAGVIVFAVFEIPVVRDARTDTDAHPDARQRQDRGLPLRRRLRRASRRRQRRHGLDHLAVL